jgi:hypothetical protein
MAPSLLAQVFAQQEARLPIEDAHVSSVPPHAKDPADASRRRAGRRSFDLDAPIEMNAALAVLTIAGPLDGQWQEERPLFCKHLRDLSLGRAVDARVGPSRFPLLAQDVAVASVLSFRHAHRTANRWRRHEAEAFSRVHSVRRTLTQKAALGVRGHFAACRIRRRSGRHWSPMRVVNLLLLLFEMRAHYYATSRGGDRW